MPSTGHKYRLVALGGTFDSLHKGHKQFLARAFELSDGVVIGVTSDELVGKTGKKHKVDSYQSRVKELERWLSEKGWSGRASVAELHDPFGPAAHIPELEAIVVTEESLPSALELNELRRQKGLKELKVESVELERSQDGRTISSTLIRRREIDREGRVKR